MPVLREGAGVPGARDETGVLAAAETLCRVRGERLTRQRRVVLSHLLAAGRPVTAYELLDLVKAEHPGIKPPSIYRSLDFLIEMGLVHRLDTTRSFVACEHPEHPHAGQFLICRRCGTVVETEDLRIARAAADLGERHGFAVDTRTVELTGVCGGCQAEGPAHDAEPAARH